MYAFPTNESINRLKIAGVSVYEINLFSLVIEMLKERGIFDKIIDKESHLSKEKIYTVENLFEQVRNAAFDKKSNLTILEKMTQKNYVDALIVSTNKLFEKTTVAGLTIDQNLQVPTICNYLDEEKMARNINYSSMKRVSEVTTYKRAELQRVLTLLNKKKNNGDASTKAHYADLIIRIKEALK